MFHRSGSKIFFAFLFSHFLFAQTPISSGSVCVAPAFSVNARSIGTDSSLEATQARKFEIQIDSMDRVLLSDKRCSLIEPLTISKPHTVKIYCNGRRIESFSFRFDQFKSKRLFLWLKEFYGTWNLTETPPRGLKCR